MNPAAMDKIELLMAYLITDLAKQIFKDYRREYGQGLEKFEPNDLNGAKIIDLFNLPGRLESEILELYGCYRESVIMDRPEPIILKQIESCFRVYCAG
jgi:adenine-specific DNA-methyltransferase